MRLRNKPGSKERLETFPNHVVNETNIDEFINQDKPLHIEIGMGKGDFIIALAKANPHINYIGIEKFPTVLVSALNKIIEMDIPNLRLCCYDAKDIDELLLENSVSKLYLNFSDPWPKTRHEKRRLTSKVFLDKYRIILNEKADIELKTDNYDLYRYSIISMNNQGLKLLQLDFNHFALFTTEYEKKFISLGLPIYYLQARFND